MNQILEIKFTPWDKINLFSVSEVELKINDWIVAKTESGTDVGKVIGIKNISEEELKKLPDIKPILRKANPSDLEKVEEKDNLKKESLRICRDLVRKHNLPMTLVDAHHSYDGGRITFAFIADGRIDFRELVKDLTNHYHKSIRLQQLGVRDAAQFMGDVGVCGVEQCCKRFLKDLGNITSEFAENQQVAHRGSDRLSGICGRLQCCLAYEQNGYLELAKKLPAIGTKYKKGDLSGTVIGWHTLKQSVDLQLDDGETIIEVSIK